MSVRHDFPYPAYMVNPNLELMWASPSGRVLLGFADREMPEEFAERKLQRILLESEQPWALGLMRYHGKLVRAQYPQHDLAKLARYVPSEFIRHDGDPHDFIEVEGARYRLASLTFREGTLVVMAPEDLDFNEKLLGGRDVVIRAILGQQAPGVIDMAVLVADIQGSTQLCAEMSPKDYFRVIEEIWTETDAILRHYHARYGKHVGDGLFTYFMPEIGADYRVNALQCAIDMRDRLAEISAQWAFRRKWQHKLLFNIGLHQGSEWFGPIRMAGRHELVILGDTVNQAARLSELARSGRILCTKNVLGKLPRQHHADFTFGVSLFADDGRVRQFDQGYALVSKLVAQSPLGRELSSDRVAKIGDIHALSVTELRGRTELAAAEHKAGRVRPHEQNGHHEPVRGQHA